MTACTEDAPLFKRFTSFNGDEIAYKQMFLKFCPLLFNFLQLHNIPARHCEGIISDAFMKLWHQRDEGRGKDIKLFLFRKITNAIQLRKSKPKDHGISPLNIFVLNQCISMPAASGVFTQKLQQAVNSLSTENQLIFYLAKECRFQFDEIAALIGKPVQSVENGLAEVVRILAEAIGQQY